MACTPEDAVAPDCFTTLPARVCFFGWLSTFREWALIWDLNVGGLRLNGSMASLAEELGIVDRLLAEAMAPSGAGGGLRFAGDAELLDVVRVLGAALRRLDGAIVAVTDRIVEWDQCERDMRLSTRAGCRDADDG